MTELSYNKKHFSLKPGDPMNLFSIHKRKLREFFIKMMTQILRRIEDDIHYEL